MKMQNGVAQNPGELNKRVEALADNLKKQGNWFKSNILHILSFHKLSIISHKYVYLMIRKTIKISCCLFSNFNANKDYYKILSVNTTASPEEIKKSFRALAKKHHPDANKGN